MPWAIAPQHDAAFLGSLKSVLRASADHLSFFLRDQRHDSDRQFIGSRHVAEHKGARNPEGEQEESVSGQTVEFCDAQR